MESQLIPTTKVVRCSYNAENVIIGFPVDALLRDIVTELQSRFKIPSMDMVNVYYTFDNQPMYSIKSDSDVNMMFVFQGLVNAPFIDLVVQESGCTSKGSNEDTDAELRSKDTAEQYHIPDLNEEEYSVNVLDGSIRSYLSEPWRRYIRDVNQRFDSVKDFREKLVKYAVESGFGFIYEKNDKVRVTAFCLKRYSEGCNWNVHARVYGPNGCFTIRKLDNEHTCTGNFRQQKHSMVNSNFVASVISENVRDKPDITPKEIVNDFKKSYGIDISYWNAWYGKELAKKDFQGDDSMSYKYPEAYVENLKQSNPKSYCSLECESGTRRFKRLFVSFGASINGFKYCRPVLCLDGTFLKSKYRGTLLAATAINGNKGIFPFAFAIVDSENEDNWHWFLEILGDILWEDVRDITIISDRHQGILQGVANLFPSSPHAYCLHHLGKNLMLKFQGGYGNSFRDGVAKLFKQCACAPTVNTFRKHMEELKRVGGDAVEQFLKGIPVKHWANAYFEGERYGEMCSNVAESFNSWILKERHMPITQLVDGIRSKLMKMFGDRNAKSEKWTSILCPVMEDELTKNVELGRHWTVSRASESIYEVQSQYRFVVDLSQRSCSCGWWRIKGFPCAHAIVAIRQSSQDVYDFFECYFTTDFYRKSYSMPIYPVPDILLVNDCLTPPHEGDILPPKTKKQPERPKNKRIKSAGEVQSKTKCGRCGAYGGHNKRTCPSTI